MAKEHGHGHPNVRHHEHQHEHPHKPEPHEHGHEHGAHEHGKPGEHDGEPNKGVIDGPNDVPSGGDVPIGRGGEHGGGGAGEPKTPIEARVSDLLNHGPNYTPGPNVTICPREVVEGLGPLSPVEAASTLPLPLQASNPTASIPDGAMIGYVTDQYGSLPAIGQQNYSAPPAVLAANGNAIQMNNLGQGGGGGAAGQGGNQGGGGNPGGGNQVGIVHVYGPAPVQNPNRVKAFLKRHWGKLLIGAGITVLGIVAVGLWRGGVFGGMDDTADPPAVNPKNENPKIDDETRTAVTVDVLSDATDGDSTIKKTSVLLYETKEAAAMGTDGVTSLTIPSEGTWTVLDGADEGKVSFTPVSGLTKDPSAVYFTVKNDTLVSNVAAITLTYVVAEPVAPPSPPVANSPMTLGDISINATAFQGAVSIDLGALVTANGATADLSTLKLYDAGLDALVSTVFATGEWRITTTNAAPGSVTFQPVMLTPPLTVAAEYSVKDTNGLAPAARGKISINVVQAPRGQLIPIETFKNLPDIAGKPVIRNVDHIDIDVIANVEGLDVNAGVSVGQKSLLLKNIDTMGEPDPGLTRSGRVDEASPERWGFTQFKIAGQGTWDVVDDGARTVLRFTHEPGFVGYPNPVNVTVTDDQGYESNLFAVHLNQDIAKVSKNIATLISASEADFWSAFEKALVPSIQDSTLEDAPLEDFYNVVVLLEIALTQEMTKMDLVLRDTYGKGVDKSRAGLAWNPKTTAALVPLIKSRIAPGFNGAAADSLQLRYARINMMRRLTRDLFVELKDMLGGMER